jgi:hypothetical protein
MRLLPIIAVWLLLLALVAVEFVTAYLLPVRGLTPFIGIGMACLVALTFMRLGSSRGLPRVFAAAGLFWVLVMMGLGSLDSFTRRDVSFGQPGGSLPATGEKPSPQ